MSAAGAREAWTVAAEIRDPEMPFLTLADLGIIREIVTGDHGTIITVTPTYTGCPAITEIKRELHGRLTGAGLGPVEVRTAIAPPWSSDWITDEGRRKLRDAGVAPPEPRSRADGAFPILLTAKTPPIGCPLCGSEDTSEVSHFGPTPCMSLRRCRACDEPFEHVKAI